MKKLLTILLIIIGFTSVAQISNTSIKKIANADSVFYQELPAHTLIVAKNTNNIYILDSAATADKTINTAYATLINKNLDSIFTKYIEVDGNVKLIGGQYSKITSITESYITTNSDFTIIAEPNPDEFSITLTSTVSNTGQELRIINAGNANLLINGEFYSSGCLQSTITPGGSFIIQYDGYKWAILALHNHSFTNCP